MAFGLLEIQPGAEPSDGGVEMRMIQTRNAQCGIRNENQQTRNENTKNQDPNTKEIPISKTQYLPQRQRLGV